MGEAGCSVHLWLLARTALAAGCEGGSQAPSHQLLPWAGEGWRASCPGIPGSSGRKGQCKGFRPLWDPGSFRNVVAKPEAGVGGESNLMGELCKQSHCTKPLGGLTSSGRQG